MQPLKSPSKGKGISIVPSKEWTGLPMASSDKSRRHRLRRWLKRKFKREDQPPANVDADVDSDYGDFSCDFRDTDTADYDDNYDCFTPLGIGSSVTTSEFRIFVGTWNVAGRSPLGSLAVDLDEWLNLKDAADIYVLGFQEIVPLNTSNVIGAEDPIPATKWNSLIGKTLNDKFGCPWLTPMLNQSVTYLHSDEEDRSSEKGAGSKIHTPMGSGTCQQESNGCYLLIASKKMVGIFISVWVKRDLLKSYYFSNVKVCSVACGIMGYLGNKGAVSVSMCIEGTSFCFVTAHLASGEKKGDEARRNHQVSEIFQRTTFPRHAQDYDYCHPQTIFGHNLIFWLGDLNYRLCLEDCLARKLINQRDWKALQEFDQLKEEKDEGVFQGWREGDIEFPPTYKYSSSNCNRYSGGLPTRTGEKQRTPAWCDRILWCGKGVKQLSYNRSESKFSDHKPVSALFSIQIEVVRYIHPLVPILPNQTSIPESQVDDQKKSTLLSLMVQDTV